MSRVIRLGHLALLMAWAAFVLPWEHCACEAHEHVVSALGHECHDHGHDHGHDDEAEHADVEFVSLRPGAAKAAGTDLSVAAAPAAVWPAPRGVAPADVPEAPVRPPAALRLGVVRLL